MPIYDLIKWRIGLATSDILHQAFFRAEARSRVWGAPVNTRNMLDGWSVLTGIASTLLAFRISHLRNKWRQRSKCQLLTSLHQIDSDSGWQSIAVERDSVPADLTVGPTLGSGTFGTVNMGVQSSPMNI